MPNRLLEVLEAVAVYGPISLDAITAKLPRTRSSVYRALVDLERTGWIRRSMNRRCFVISSKMEKLADLQFNVSDDVSAIINVLKNHSKKSKLVFSVIIHVKGSEFSVIDSNQFPLRLAVQSTEKNDALHRLILALRHAGHLPGPSRIPNINDPCEYANLIDKLEKNGFLFDEELWLGMLPIVLSSSEFIIITCRSKDHTIFRELDAFVALDEIYKSLSAMNVFTFKSNDGDKLVAE